MNSQQSESLDGSPLAVAFRTAGKVRVVELAGELDLNTIPKLETRLFNALKPDAGVILDLRRLSFIDSSGIALLIRAHQAEGGDLRTVISRGSQVERVLAIAGIDRVLPIGFDLDEAVASLPPRAPRKKRSA